MGAKNDKIVTHRRKEKKITPISMVLQMTAM
jgi:hypothetical protein